MLSSYRDTFYSQGAYCYFTWAYFTDTKAYFLHLGHTLFSLEHTLLCEDILSSQKNTKKISSYRVWKISFSHRRYISTPTFSCISTASSRRFFFFFLTLSPRRKASDNFARVHCTSQRLGLSQLFDNGCCIKSSLIINLIILRQDR